MPSCSASRRCPGMQIVFLPDECRRGRPLPAPAIFAESDSSPVCKEPPAYDYTLSSVSCLHCPTFSPTNLKCELDLSRCRCCGGKQARTSRQCTRGVEDIRVVGCYGD